MSECGSGEPQSGSIDNVNLIFTPDSQEDITSLNAHDSRHPLHCRSSQLSEAI